MKDQDEKKLSQSSKGEKFDLSFVDPSEKVSDNEESEDMEDEDEADESQIIE